MDDLFDFEEMLKQIKEAKKYCREHGIDWDAIETDYKPKVMEYSSQGVLW